MKIHFYAGKCLPIHSKTLDERPLGGTETALIRLAEELSKRGHQVRVYTAHQNPPTSNPEYIYAGNVMKREPCDIFVILKEWWPALFEVPCKELWYWTGDSFDQYVNYGLGDRRVHRRIDKFLAVSQWQADNLSRESGFPREKAHVIQNAIHLEDFEGEEERNRKKLFFSSSPYRGLALLPNLYSPLKEKHPDLKLEIFSGLAVYDTDKSFEGPQKQQYEALVNELKTLKDCQIHGNIKQSDLAREFMKCGILFYPNIFLETSCITAMEAMAAGAVPVTSKLGALPETIGDAGKLIEGKPGSEAYTKAFIEATDELLSNEELWNEYSQKAKKRASQMTWDKVADRFEALLPN